MKILKSKKMLLSLVCALVLVFGSCMTVSASVLIVDSETSETMNSEWCKTRVETLDNYLSEHDYILGAYRVYIASSSSIFVFSDNSPFTVDVKSWEGGLSCDDTMDVYTFDASTLAFMNSGSYGAQTFGGSAGYLFATTHDLYSLDGNLVMEATADFFPKTPTLTPIVAGMEMNPLVQILGLIPLLVPCLVGLVALRKGLATLWAHLRKA